MSDWFQHDWCSPCVLVLGHFLWQGTLIALLTATAMGTVRSAAVRYRLSLSSMLMMAVCPVLTLGWLNQPDHSTSELATTLITFPEIASDSTVRSEVPDAQRADAYASNLPVIPNESVGTVSAAERKPFVAQRIDQRDWQKLTPVLASVYFGGVALMWLRLVIGLWGGRRLRKRATAVTNETLLSAVQRQADALGLKLRPALAYCERVTVPTVLGVFRPMILLPLALASSLSPDQIESVLAHELAHLRRYDHLVNLLQRVIESLLFFHPAVWWVSHRMREEREHCCDDLVVACGAIPLDYARSLLRVAELSRTSRLSNSVTAVSLLATGNRPSSLRQRISRLLGESPTPSLRVSPSAVLIAICIPLIAVIATIQSGASNQQSARPVDDGQPGGKKTDPTVNLPKVGEETESVPGSSRIFVGEPLERKVSLHLTRTPLFEVLTTTCEAAGLKLNLDGEALKSRGYTENMAIAIDVDGVSLRDALTQILKRYQDLSFMLDGDQILVSTRKQIEAKEKAGQQQGAEGVKSLEPYPKLHGLSLNMTEEEFVEIARQQELKTKKTSDDGKVTHHIALGDNHTLIVMFDKDEKCTGIQRVRGDVSEEERAVPADETADTSAPVIDQADTQASGSVLIQLNPPPVIGDFSSIDDPEVLLEQLSSAELQTLMLMTGGGFMQQPGRLIEPWAIRLWEQRFVLNGKLDPRVQRLIELGPSVTPRIHQRLKQLAASDSFTPHLVIVLRSTGTRESIPLLIGLLEQDSRVGEFPERGMQIGITEMAVTSALWNLTGRRHVFTSTQWKTWWQSVEPDFVVARDRERPEHHALVTVDRVNALLKELATNEVAARERLIALGPLALPHLLAALAAELPKPPLEDANPETVRVSPQSVRLAWVIDELGATADLPSGLRRAYFTQRFASASLYIGSSPLDEEAACRALSHCSFADFCSICIETDRVPTIQPLRFRNWLSGNMIIFSRRFGTQPVVSGDPAWSPFWNQVIPSNNPPAEIMGAVPVIIRALNDEDASRRTCAAALADIIGFCSTEKPEELIIALRDGWLRESQTDVRLDIGLAMARFSTPLVLEAISQGLNSNREEIVSDAAALVDWTNFELNDQTRADFARLVELTHHENDRLRIRAVRSLCGKAPSLLEPELNRLITDNVEDIRKECAFALRDRPDPKFADVLFKLAVDPSVQVRIEALSSIGNLNHPASMKRLLPHLRDKQVQGYAASALASMGGKDSLPLMMSELEAGNDVGGMIYQYLRQLTSETFEDKPEPWLTWWRQ